MNTFLALALRNIGRNKARSALTIGAITFSVAMTILLSSMVSGMRNMMMDDIILGRTGAIQVHRAGYFDARDNQPLELDMEHGGELQKRLESVPGISSVAPRITFSGLVNNGAQATMFIGQAISPEEESRTLPLSNRDVSGRPVTGGEKRSAVVGLSLAEALGVGVGGTVVLQASSREKKENAMDLAVGGTNHNSNPMESKRLVYVSLDFAQELLGMQGRVTEYALAVAERDRIDELAASVRTALGPEYEVHAWHELRPGLLDVLDLQRAIFTFIAVVFLVISVIGVVNTMLMSVMERTREIGTMVAVGVRRDQISRLFLMEAGAQALIGGALGVTVGVGVALLVGSQGGVPIMEPGGTVPLRLTPAVSTSFAIGVVAAATLGATLAAFWPASRASGLRPVDALRAT